MRKVSSHIPYKIVRPFENFQTSMKETCCLAVAGTNVYLLPYIQQMFVKNPINCLMIRKRILNNLYPNNDGL